MFFLIRRLHRGGEKRKKKTWLRTLRNFFFFLFFLKNQFYHSLKNRKKKTVFWKSYALCTGRSGGRSGHGYICTAIFKYNNPIIFDCIVFCIGWSPAPKKKKKRKRKLLFFFLNAHATTRRAPGWSFKRSFGVTLFVIKKIKIKNHFFLLFPLTLPPPSPPDPGHPESEESFRLITRKPWKPTLPNPAPRRPWTLLNKWPKGKFNK